PADGHIGTPGLRPDVQVRGAMGGRRPGRAPRAGREWALRGRDAAQSRLARRPGNRPWLWFRWRVARARSGRLRGHWRGLLVDRPREGPGGRRAAPPGTGTGHLRGRRPDG